MMLIWGFGMLLLLALLTLIPVAVALLVMRAKTIEPREAQHTEGKQTGS